MNTRLPIQIRDYGEQLVDSHDPITDAEVLGYLRTVRELPLVETERANTGLGWVVAAVAGVAVLIVVAMQLGLRTVDTPPATDDPTASTQPTDTSPDRSDETTSTTPPSDRGTDALIAPGWTWASSPTPEVSRFVIGRLGTGAIVWLVSDGQDDKCLSGVRIIDCNHDNPPSGATALSNDPQIAVVEADGSSRVVTLSELDILSVDGQLIADGMWVAGGHESEGEPGHMLLTKDGVNWQTRLLSDGLDAHTLQHGASATSLGDTIVISGGVVVASLGPDDPFHVVLEPSRRGGGSVNSPVFVLNGTLHVLIDDDVRENASSPIDGPVVWRSTDGVDWQPAGQTSGLVPRDPGYPLNVTVIDDTAIAVWTYRDGTNVDASLRVAVSTDGMTWTPIDPVDGLGRSIADHDPRGRPYGEGDFRVWGQGFETDGWMVLRALEGDSLVSNDGMTWYLLPPNPEAPSTVIEATYKSARDKFRLLWYAVPPPG